MIMKSMNSNVHTKFTINLKDISADKEITLKNDSHNSSVNFDPSNPEGNFTMDLAESYNQTCLQRLLEAAERAATASGGAFEMKQCFHSA